eukprot:XP_011681003.1 PREDICTED: uncharacterized protein LOC105446199 [Strongylocentrotus purpuratus]
MNSWYLQFVFAMVLVVNGISCDSEMLHCGIDGTTDFTVAADDDDDDEDALQNMSLDVNANITCGASDTWRGEEWFSFEIVCPVEWRILLRVSPMDINKGIIVKAFPDEEGEEHSISRRTRPPNYPILLLSKDNILEINATYSGNTMQNKMFKLSAWTVKVVERIGPDSSCQVKQTSKDTDATCEERCDNGYDQDLPCQCNDRCQDKDKDDCCEDYKEICLNEGNDARTLEIECPTNSSYDDVLVSFGYEIAGEVTRADGHLTVICTRIDGQSFDVDFSQSTHLGISCKRMLDTLSINITAPARVNILESAIRVETIVFNRDSSLGSETGKSTTTQIVVPTVVVLVVLGLGVFIASMRYKRRNKQASANAENVSAQKCPYLHNHVSSEGGDATDNSPRYVTSNAGPEGDGTVALNIMSTVNQNEDTVVYNEIGEQDYNTLFGGKERDDYHEYNVPDRPQGKTSVVRTTASGSGPHRELFLDGTRAVAVVNRSPGVTGPKHGVADDLHAYQDLRLDDTSVSSHPNGEMPNQLPSKDRPATENGYQALKTATPDYATLKPSPEPATLEQNDQSMTGTSDVSGPPSDKQYDTLQRSINTVGQPPSAGYGTLKPMNETDDDYESPDGKPNTTCDVKDSTRPTEALPIDQPKTKHSVSYDDDDYQTPIEPAEDLSDAYQTLDNPGYQQEPDTQTEEYSHLQRSLGAKLQSHPSSIHDNSDSYGTP